jgi:hypothetical protein
METGSQKILDYAAPVTPKPRRYWMPVVCLGIAFGVWNWPRLTPTGFPNRADLGTLVLLVPAAVVMARFSSLPRSAFALFGAAGVAFFLLANLNDNNFRANTVVSDVMLAWCATVAAGALVGVAVAMLSRGEADGSITSPAMWKASVRK